ncbi:hypothetical protein ABR737_00685 [Streptomyces sp. Edi2]|uniref:hypothetical protein n=1 Tax=Streptomyces sp. Edi2 TaxID=3162528 RepID=UPI003305FE67
MAKEFHVQLSDETADAFKRAAEAEHVDPIAYVGSFLEASVPRLLFLNGAQAAIDEHGGGFARRFGPARAADNAA